MTKQNIFLLNTLLDTIIDKNNISILCIREKQYLPRPKNMVEIILHERIRPFLTEMKLNLHFATFTCFNLS